MKLNMIVCVKFLLNILTKIKKNLFYKHEYKNKTELFKS